MPSRATIVRIEGREALGRALAGWVPRALGEPGRWVALAVGESTLPLYSTMPDSPDLWTGKRIVTLDELVPSGGDRSFSTRLSRSLPTSLRDRLDPIVVEPDADAQADALEERLAREGLAAVVLGLGPDGHIAFNQPGASLDSTTRMVTLTPMNRQRLGGDATHALTMGVATIMRARAIALVAAGAGKADALRRLLDGPEGSDMPATWLRRHPSLTVFADEASCA